MIKYILGGGYLIHKSPDGGKSFCEELVKGINKKPVKILDCMFARPRDSWEEKIEEDRLFFEKNIKDFELELADPDKFTEQVKNSDVIFLRGGSTELLLELLNKNSGWVSELEGKVLAGTSAGADIISKYSFNLDELKITECLGLLSIKFIPHWNSDYNSSNIKWDIVWQELKDYKEDLPVPP